jgi:putative membrane protein
MLRWFLAAFHLLALGIGLGAVWTRARVLGGRIDNEALRRAFAADTWWGLAGALWIGTGLWRLFGSTEKGTDYYLGNHLFWTKMLLLAALLAMEVRPAITLVGWRRLIARGIPPETSGAPRLARLSYAQAVCVVLMVLVATGMARGIGAR